MLATKCSREVLSLQSASRLLFQIRYAMTNSFAILPSQLCAHDPEGEDGTALCKTGAIEAYCWIFDGKFPKATKTLIALA